MRDRLSLNSKLHAVIGKLAPGLVAARTDYHKTAVILFTSGTEGEPKGVALSHENVLANVAQVRAHIDLYPGQGCAVQSPCPCFIASG